MPRRRSVLFAAAASVLAAPLGARAADPLSLDTDGDGTLDLNEVKQAATARFMAMDRDHDGTLTRKEMAGRLNAAQFSRADPDHDGTVTLQEYLAVVEQRFHRADPDNDGTLSRAELNAPAGRALMRLLQ